jgi:hypothetical protein
LTPAHPETVLRGAARPHGAIFGTC